MLDALDQAADRGDVEHHPRQPEDPEPDNRVELADGREPDVPQEVSFLQAVERLARHAEEELDADQQHDDPLSPGVAAAAHGRRAQLGKRGGTLLARPADESRLRHEESGHDPAREREGAADDHPRL